MYETINIDLAKDYQAGIEKACSLIKQNELVVFPTETVYGLGANALSEEAVKKVFVAKGRPQDNPLITHVSSIEQAKELAYIDEKIETILREFWPGAFTAVLKKKDIIPDIVTAGLDTIAIRIPESKSLLDVINKTGLPIAAPSANKSGSPSPTHAFHVQADLSGRVPLILDGGGAKYGLESTVCDLTQRTPLILRPGAVTAEDIKEFFGSVKISPHVLGPLGPDEVPISPGVKHKHYAPKADIVVVEGPKENTIKKIAELYDEDEKNGINPVIFCYKEDSSGFGDRHVVFVGENQDLNSVAKNLFKNLRDIDEKGYSKVFFQAVPTTGIGLAVMNRIIRAAEFDLLLVK